MPPITTMGAEPAASMRLATLSPLTGQWAQNAAVPSAGKTFLIFSLIATASAPLGRSAVSAQLMAVRLVSIVEYVPSALRPM